MQVQNSHGCVMDAGGIVTPDEDCIVILIETHAIKDQGDELVVNFITTLVAKHSALHSGAGYMYQILSTAQGQAKAYKPKAMSMSE
jgi:hypothetical protein